MTVDAEMETFGTQPPPSFTGFATLTLIARVNGEDLFQTLGPIRESGTFSFPDTLPNGTIIDVEAFETSQRTFCIVDPRTQEIEFSDPQVTLTCHQSTIPKTCPLNPRACVAPPDGCEIVLQGFLGDARITTGNGYLETIVVDGQELYNQVTNTFERTIPINLTSLRCAGEFQTGIHKSETVILAPILYSRNAPAEPVSGETVIWGVARDDTYGVSRVEVYLDGQLAPLSQFAFNLRNSMTCSEFSTGGACDDYSSFYGILDTTSLSPGRHSIVINATNSAGASSVTTTEILVAPQEPPDVSLVASYLPAAGGPRTTHNSRSADPQATLGFRYDESQGTYHQRIGGTCDSGTDNPTYFKVRLGGDPDFRIDGCEVRGSWDSQWYPCPEGVVNDINARDHIVLATDSHLYSPCDFDDPIAPHMSPDQPAWFKVRFMDGGLVYERRIDMMKAPSP